MHPLGSKKTRTHVAGHQECADCHPEPKGGRAADLRRALKQLLPDDWLAYTPDGYNPPEPTKAKRRKKR
jgi:hypothetical protein